MKNENNVLQPKTSDITARQMNFIHRLLNVTVGTNLSNLSLTEIYKRNTLVVSSRASFNSDPFSCSGDFTDLISLSRLECINLNYFSWININNSRLCNYIWSYIRLFKMSSITNSFTGASKINKDDILNTTSDPRDNFTLKTSLYLYELFCLKLLPNNNKEKKDCVISFFDMLDASPILKGKIINELERKWITYSEKKDVDKWINKENQAWAWNYIYANSNPVWFYDNGQFNNLQDGIVTTFDLLNEIPDSRQLLLKNMKSAWSQKAYRDKNNGKKAVSIVLSEDIIKKLDFICENTDRRKNEVVTRLIREEYDKIKKGGR